MGPMMILTLPETPFPHLPFVLGGTVDVSMQSGFIVWCIIFKSNWDWMKYTLDYFKYTLMTCPGELVWVAGLFWGNRPTVPEKSGQCKIGPAWSTLCHYLIEHILK